MVDSFDGLKVFSATKAKEREELGERITDWLTNNTELEVADKVITQSSDSEFHCLTITLFYKGKVTWNPNYLGNGTYGNNQPKVEHRRGTGG